MNIECIIIALLNNPIIPLHHDLEGRSLNNQWPSKRWCMSNNTKGFSSRGVYRISVLGSIPDNLIERISAIHAAAALLGINKKEADMSYIDSSYNRQKQEPDAE